MVRLFILFSLMVLPGQSWGQSYESGDKQIALMELYSSEGCSSCPPADRWVASLKGHKQLWKDFVPLNFHVDYWNYLGWNDRFSHKQYTRRQRRFAAEWGSSRVYTPGFVLNGKEWRRRNLSGLKGGVVGNLKAEKIDESHFKVSFTPVNKSLKGFKVHVALLGNGLSTKVKYGENAGETLKHEFVVLGTRSNTLKSKGKSYEGTIELPKSQAKGVGSFGVAFWVSGSGSQKPLQAVGGPLAMK